MRRSVLTRLVALLSAAGRKSESTAIFAAVLGACALTAFASTTAMAKSNRCPDDSITGPPALAGASSRISVLWKAIHGPGADGGDGPLACPVGPPVEYPAPGGPPPNYSWRGVGQTFQRGWILIGRDASAGSEIAAVRGWDSWTVWWKGLPAGVETSIWALPGPTPIPPAADFGGQVRILPGKDKKALGLLQCPIGHVGLFSVDCSLLTPELKVSDRPFDVAARLDLNTLAVPNVGRRTERINAVFPDWLPCFTRGPASEPDMGEPTIARAITMLRRDVPCPITNLTPSTMVKDWLASLTFPAEQLPGTSTDTWPCERKGELDVILVQMLNLAFKYKAALAGPPLERIKVVLAHWGGRPRDSPYITPNGTCFDRGVIETENHILLQEATRYLINNLREIPSAGNRDWLVKFLQQIARRDFYEFNALPYSRYQMKALFALNDYAPDAAVSTAALGVLDWLFAKEAVSGNLDRDHRPYRRRPDSGILGAKAWWSVAATPVATAASILAGPMQHVHYDLDVQIDEKEAKKALFDLVSFPEFGTASAYFGEVLVDAANTTYTLPRSLTGWFENRFTSEEANRNTYLQAIRHGSPIGDDPALFKQPNSGSELVSGNRNWTIIAGGTHAPPGWPGTPPDYTPVTFPLSLLVSTISDAVANQKQRDKLWEDQAGVLRETMLITTPVGLSREQTIRFQGAVVSSQYGIDNQRLCVAEGFLCGFDLRWPDKPFPSSDALDCPIKTPPPPDLIAHFQGYVGSSQTMTERLGCLLKYPGVLPGGAWQIWTFERGMLALGVTYGPANRFAGAWTEGRTTKVGTGQLRVVWKNAEPSNWFRVHAYDRNVSLASGEPPGGWLDPLLVVGDPDSRTQHADGDVSFDLRKLEEPASWNLLIVGCTKDINLGVTTGHDCHANILPKLTVLVGPEPTQAFACAVAPPPPPNPTFQARPSEGIVLEVGSCLASPYGLFVYVWHNPCPAPVLVAVAAPAFPNDVTDYGFVAVAPSRGWTLDDFRKKVEDSMAVWRAGGNGYVPGQNAAINVPISPPVSRTGNKWIATGVSSQHTVTFKWSAQDGSSILGDTGAPGLFDPAALGGLPSMWPSAIGHVSAPDAAVPTSALIHSSGSGCFTMAGFPTPSDPDPAGLLVDLRNISSPIVGDRRTSDLAPLCP